MSSKNTLKGKSPQRCMRYKTMNKKAEAGIGTLILFIALILVAAVAAGVLIQTAGSLQSRALATGDEARRSVSTAVTVTSVYGMNGSRGNIADFFAEVRLAAGSDPVKLNDTLVDLILSNMSNSYRFNASAVTQCNASVTQNTATGSGFSRYDFQYTLTSSNFISGYLQQGDVGILCFRAIRNVSENEVWNLIIVPRAGQSASVQQVVPNTLTTLKVDLYP
jgi:archaeal flagellin FlaB